MRNPNDWYNRFAIPVPVRDNDYMEAQHGNYVRWVLGVVKRKKALQNGRSDPMTLRINLVDIRHLILLKHKESFHKLLIHRTNSHHSTPFH